MGGEWLNLTLGDLGRIVTGKTPLTSIEGNFGGHIPFVTPSDMDGRKTISTTARFLTSVGAESVKGSVIPAGAIMVSCIGSDMGKVLIAGRECVTNQQINSIVVDGRFSSEYVYYSLSTRKNEIRHRAAGGSAVPILNKGDFSRMEITLPPLPEQKAIASVLGALDDKIELNRRMNATLEAMARALFQSWFVDFNPVRAKLDGRQPGGMDKATAALFPDSFQDSPLGNIPTDWDAIPLYDTAQWVNGAAFKSDDFCLPGEGLPIIKIAELKDGIGAQTKWCQREADADKIIETGDLVYSWSGSPDTSLEAFLWSGGRGLLNQHIFKVISPTAAEKRFVYYLLQYLRPVLVETARNKQTTGLGHVTIADMKRLMVCMPSKEVLAAFEGVVAPIFDKAFKNTLESRTLATLRDTLLPKLLSGVANLRKHL
jgi:type I restriction enzyme S subunit